MSGALPSWARKGNKVVCVDASRDPCVVDLVLNATYTIRAIGTDYGGYGLYLEEVVNGEHPLWAEEYGYAIRRFRPLVTTKTEAEDVAMFRDLIRHPEAA